MPAIYYAYYTPISDSIESISRQEHTLGRSLLAQGLRNLFHLQINDDEMESLLKYDRNGKPYLPQNPEICFNITHCSHMAACAFHSKPIGIDAEAPGYFPEILVDRALSEDEKSFLQSKGTDVSTKQEWFYRLWTLKEAYVKQSGIGVDTDLTDFSFSYVNNETDLSVICSDPSVSCYQTKMPHGQILSVCYEDNGEPVTFIACSLQRARQK